ncbi:hypothetical protein CFN78_24645 [Amycolatopsis antarctica]|uniref:Uncharacterized protein n=1 Tax=Amycolatopsis antarctica TaxID=1854586 RepID=A0A263CWT0_9PSEU|nr:hypothetical protein [Amycolatopsis antarctica]OZM70593.1 hypothetical protein CFN78_24645 [Amycolatopsis antarctica]
MNTIRARLDNRWQREPRHRSAFRMMAVVILLSLSTPTMIPGWTLPDDHPGDLDELNLPTDENTQRGEESRG